MRLETDYWHAMDRQAAQEFQVSPEYIGVSGHPAKRAIEQLKTKIFEGAKNVEIGFTSTGKGSLAQGGTTPEMYGTEDREDIRELAKINEVETSVHAAINLMGFAGLTDRGFSEEARENALNEVKRTLDFAADTAGGGPVVVHTGEFQRPLHAIEKGKFRAYPEEEKESPVYVVDKRTGQLSGLKRNTEIALPRMDEETGEIIRDEKGQPIIDYKTYVDFEKEFKDLSEKDKNKYETPEKFFYATHLKKEKEMAEGETQRFEQGLRGEREFIKDLNDKKKNLETIKTNQGKTEFVVNLLKPRDGMLSQRTTDEIAKDPEQALNQFIDRQKQSIGYYNEAIRSYIARASDIQKNIDNTMPVEEYAVKKSAETLAKAGIYAYEREKAENLTKPLFVAPENVFAEQFGSHPRELRKLIVDSREEMAKQLNKDRGISMHEAKEIAEDHIKATFDVGHAYTWKKYFQPLQGESLKQTEERFNKWLKKEVESLAKDKIIGHVHLSDNFGYHDEHLAPGQGHVPIKDFVKTLQKEGFDKKMIVEAGAQPEQLVYQTMTGAWSALNSPIYRIDGTSQSWTDIGQSYFAKTGSPNYVVGDYAPSKDWTLWSETQLE